MTTHCFLAGGGGTARGLAFKAGALLPTFFSVASAAVACSADAPVSRTCPPDLRSLIPAFVSYAADVEVMGSDKKAIKETELERCGTTP